ncbi:MAG TPA: nicotinate-nucleotide adenylyltransferase [Patescibacteria group bacterium]|nr:nicotinate-nucleotide adenylyltransferase [Patescibacteria group bacterium]
MTFTPPHLLDGTRWAGLRIGLLGGSFSPPHRGHVHISLIALQALQLDFIWWLVTPHNPLKPQSTLMPYEKRLTLCRQLVQNPQILVTDLERQLEVNRTWDTVRALKRSFPHTSFAWITGMDNALNFHRWYRWKDILKEIATVHISRPPAESLVGACPLRWLSTQSHDSGGHSKSVDLAPGHSIWLLQKEMMDVSSTMLKNNNKNN